MKTFHLDFEPIGRRGDCRADQSLLDSARQLGVDLISVCGGLGICGRCVVQGLTGDLTEPGEADRENLSAHELAQGYRLACMAYPLSDCKLGVPAESISTPMRTQVEGLEVEVKLDPLVHSVVVELPAPSLGHASADAENLLTQVNQAGQSAHIIDLVVLQDLSPRLREWNWRCQAHVRQGEIIAVMPVKAKSLGLAVDLGSTKIAGYLVDLPSGQTLAAKGLMNPQISYGEDIISRCARAAKSAEGRQQMQQIVVEALNGLAADLCAEAEAAVSEIVEAVIVGNTAMHHLLLGLPTGQLIAAPYVPAVTGAVDIKAREIGLTLAGGATLHLLPNVAGFVGADHVAMLLGIAGEWSKRNVLALDIGTNTEISLIKASGQMHCLSCASGPAFEGYHIKDGTRARPGAIEKVKINAGQIFYQTIAGAPPAGICGSGILDAVAQLRLAEVLADNGRIQAGSHSRLRSEDSQHEFVLVEAEVNSGGKEITVTQNDVREIQLAKAAIQAGIQALMAEAGLTLAELEMVIIAGAFGSYIDIPNAIAIGMLPSLPLERFKQVGNAAGIGAKLALLSAQQRAEAQALGHRLNYIELARYPRFAYMFAQSCALKPYV